MPPSSAFLAAGKAPIIMQRQAAGQCVSNDRIGRLQSLATGGFMLL